MALHPRFFFPDYSRLLAEGKRTQWTLNPGVDARQTTVPKDNHLRKRLGMDVADRIDVFAGMGGDWARSLKADRYTDLSPTMMQYASEHPKNRLVRQYRVKNAWTTPERPNRFDWSFSFEPIPMMGASLALSVLRALWANRKGLKIVHVAKDEGLTAHFEEHCRDLFNHLSRTYGATYDAQDVYIDSVYPTRSRATLEYPHVVHTIQTSSQSRQKAALDLKVIAWLNRRHFFGQSGPFDIRQLRTHLTSRKRWRDVTREQLDESLARIHSLSDFIHEHHLASVSLDSGQSPLR